MKGKVAVLLFARLQGRGQLPDFPGYAGSQCRQHDAEHGNDRNDGRPDGLVPGDNSWSCGLSKEEGGWWNPENWSGRNIMENLHIELREKVRRGETK